jgi:hypothetical protein
MPFWALSGHRVHYSLVTQCDEMHLFFANYFITSLEGLQIDVRRHILADLAGNKPDLFDAQFAAACCSLHRFRDTSLFWNILLYHPSRPSNNCSPPHAALVCANRGLASVGPFWFLFSTFRLAYLSGKVNQDSNIQDLFAPIVTGLFLYFKIIQYTWVCPTRLYFIESGQSNESNRMREPLSTSLYGHKKKERDKIENSHINS